MTLRPGDLPRVDKGKARALADPNEHTPLLSDTVSSSRSRSLTLDNEERIPASQDNQHSRLLSKLLSVFFVSLCVSILLFVLVALLAYSYGSDVSREAPNELVRRALVIRGPDRIDVHNISSNGEIWTQVSGRVGVNAGAVLGVNSDEEDDVLRNMWKSIGRWAVHRVDRISVDLSTIVISSEHGHLADISFPSCTLPLTVNPPQDPSWLTPMSVPVLIKPTRDVGTLARFIRDSWRDGFVNVQATVNETSINALNGWLHFSRKRVSSTVRMPLPHLPPPDRIPVSLLSFLIESTPDHLALSANATIENPVPEDTNVHATVPALPFTVSLPANGTLAPIANVTTAPIVLTYPKVAMSISGTVLPIPPTAQAALSHFLSLYLQAQDNPIVITTPYLPGLTFPTMFPAPHPKPQVLRNVTIRNMIVRYSPDGKGGMLASGTVFGRAVLPEGIKVGLDVKRIFPDVLVFDGDVPGDGEGGDDGSYKNEAAYNELHLPHIPHPHVPRISAIPLRHPSLPSMPSSLPSLIPSGLPKPHIPLLPIGHKSPHSHSPVPPPSPPLPTPLPPRAFAHIRPDDWLPATSTPVDGGVDEGSAVEVEAKIVDVPLAVLPGRDKEFRNFVGKVIFSTQGALAGVQGTAAVGVRIEGLPFKHDHDHAGEMELTGLPFAGRVRIGKKAAF